MDLSACPRLAGVQQRVFLIECDPTGRALICDEVPLPSQHESAADGVGNRFENADDVERTTGRLVLAGGLPNREVHLLCGHGNLKR
jgi:hypothetical protein